MSARIFRFESTETDDRGDQQLLKGYGLHGEELADVHRVMPFGLASNAPQGSHAIGLAAMGRRSQVVALGLEHQQHRPKNLQPGEVSLYDMHGNVISVVQQKMRYVHSADQQFVVGGMMVRVRPGRVDLGAMEAPHAVQTTGGASTKIFSVV